MSFFEFFNALRSKLYGQAERDAVARRITELMEAAHEDAIRIQRYGGGSWARLFPRAQRAYAVWDGLRRAQHREWLRADEQAVHGPQAGRRTFTSVAC